MNQERVPSCTENEKPYGRIEDQNTLSPRPNTWTYEENKQYILFLK